MTREGKYPETIYCRPRIDVWTKFEERAAGKGVSAVTYARNAMFAVRGFDPLLTTVLRNGDRIETSIRIPVPEGTHARFRRLKKTLPGTFGADTEDTEIVDAASVFGEPGATVRRQLSELISW